MRLRALLTCYCGTTEPVELTMTVEAWKQQCLFRWLKYKSRDHGAKTRAEQLNHAVSAKDILTRHDTHSGLSCNYTAAAPAAHTSFGLPAVADEYRQAPRRLPNLPTRRGARASALSAAHGPAPTPTPRASTQKQQPKGKAYAAPAIHFRWQPSLLLLRFLFFFSCTTFTMAWYLIEQTLLEPSHGACQCLKSWLNGLPTPEECMDEDSEQEELELVE